MKGLHVLGPMIGSGKIIGQNALRVGEGDGVDESLKGGEIGLGIAVGADFQQDDVGVLACCPIFSKFPLTFRSFAV